MLFSRRDFVATAAGAASLFAAGPGLAAGCGPCGQDDLVGCLRDAGWRRKEAADFAALHQDWLRLLAGEDRNAACSALARLRALGPLRSVQRLLADHPGAGPLFMRFVDPETAAKDFLDLLGRSPLEVQREALALLGRSGGAAEAREKLKNMTQRLGPLARELLSRHRADVVGVLSPGHALTPGEARLHDWWTRQAEVARRDDAALDVLVWILRAHGPAMGEAARRGFGAGVISLLELIQPLRRSAALLDPQQARSLTAREARHLQALGHGLTWRLAERRDGGELLGRWGALAVLTLHGDASGAGYSRVSERARDQVAEQMRSAEDETGFALIALRNTPDFHLLLEQGLDSLTLRWLLARSVRADGSVDAPFLAGHVGRSAATLHELARKEDSLVSQAPVLRTLDNVMSSLIHDTPFEIGEVFDLVEDVYTVGEMVATLGLASAARASLRATAAEIARTGARTSARSALVRRYASLKRRYDEEIRSLSEQLQDVALDTTLAVWPRRRSARRDLSRALGASWGDREPTLKSPGPSPRPGAEAGVGAHLAVLGLDLISMAEVVQRLENARRSREFQNSVLELLAEHETAFEASVGQAAQVGISARLRRTHLEEAHRRWNSGFGVIWGLVRTI